MTDNETSLNFDIIKRFQSDLNINILKRLNRAIVFADCQFIEWFHLTIGVDALLKEGGAFNVKSFSSLQVGLMARLVYILNYILTLIFRVAMII